MTAQFITRTLAMTRTFRALFLIASLLVALASAANVSYGADQRELLGSFRDWDALVITRDNGERICYMISVPKETSPNNVRRGDIYAMVTMRPRARIVDEVNIIVGYPFRASSEASATIGNRQFTMFTEGDGAWLRTPQEDSQMVTAMRAGSSMQVRGTSSRGTNTRDRYSLIGFTAAYNAITEACKQ
jgi:Invasion associated locus B (IalB) protein